MVTQQDIILYSLTQSSQDNSGYLRGLVSANGATAGIQIVHLQSTQQFPITGSTVETTVFKKTFPANYFQPNDQIIVEFEGSNNNNANNKSIYVYINNVQVSDFTVTTNTTQYQRVTYGIRSLTLAVGPNQYGGPSFGNGYAGSVPATAAISTAAPIVVTIRLKLANAADTITLEQARISTSAGVGVNEA